ncbi:29578_t:CDS:2 [Gigaspora margarita]|uniref:29578_t:CDS:1 n=1 Tax=Gigaspora margarita TaxID=4874 RepID=A0ABN7V5D3_GIGMA|nr:29578_t:CDS:2 [Gigaspora margarita]
MPVTEYFITREEIVRSLNETERFSKENLAKRTLTKKTGKTRNSIAIITDDREDSIINNVLRSQSNTRRPLRSIQNESAMCSNRIELEKKRGKQNEQEIKLTQDENLFKKDSILEQILNRLQKIKEKQASTTPKGATVVLTKTNKQNSLLGQKPLKITNNMLNKDINKILQQNIDNIWASIETGILYAAKQNIPFRKIPNSTKKALSTNKKTKSSLW